MKIEITVKSGPTQGAEVQLEVGCYSSEQSRDDAVRAIQEVAKEAIARLQSA